MACTGCGQRRAAASEAARAIRAGDLRAGLRLLPGVVQPNASERLALEKVARRLRDAVLRKTQ